MFFIRTGLISRRLLKAAALLVAAALTACTAPLPPIEIRAGLTAQDNLDSLRPPSGKRYTYALEFNGEDLQAEMVLTSRRLSAKRYSYTGNMILIAPTDPQNLAEVAKQIERVFQAKGPKIRGNRIFVPVSLRTDNRFRATTSSLLSSELAFAPHDCFGEIGTCRHVSTAQNGLSVPIVSQTTETDGVWRSVRRVDPSAKLPAALKKSRNTLIYSIGSDGVMLDLIAISQGNGPRSSSVMRRK